jgi:Family of unknown function (DUF5685)
MRASRATFAAGRLICDITAMFGVVRPCKHRLGGSGYAQWMAHLCGLCLTLRDLHGQSARLVTNYDGLLVSVLTEAQNPAVTPHRTAGPCALRGFRRADVVDAAASGARLAAAVSLVLAAGKIKDHVQDRDGAFARRAVAAGAGLAADRLDAAGRRTSAALGFDNSVLTGAISRQVELEKTAGLDLDEVTEPTETAVSAAFAHTAVLSGRPANTPALAEAGRRFGRIAHLLDAVEDLPSDQAADTYNPLLATRTSTATAWQECGDALGGLRTAVAELDCDRPVLAQSLLVSEVRVAMDKVFARARLGLPARPGSGGPGTVFSGLACRRAPRNGRPPRSPGEGCPDCCGDCCCECCLDCLCSNCDC